MDSLVVVGVFYEICGEFDVCEGVSVVLVYGGDWVDAGVEDGVETY